MEKEKSTLESLTKGGKYCIKCGSNIPEDKIGHKCELMECPKTKENGEEGNKTKKLADTL